MEMERLVQIKDDLEALLVFINLPSGDAESSVRTEEIFSPIILLENLDKNCTDVPTQRAARDEPAQLTPTVAAGLASEDYQALLAIKGGPSWPNLIETSATASSWLGISQRAWGEACRTMGRERAAVCVLVIDRNWRLPEGHRYRARSPQHCLAGMAKQTRAGGFNLTGLARAGEVHRDDEETAPHIETAPPTKSAFAFAASEALSRIQRNMEARHDR
jgi:hypothetical protein